MRGLTRSFGSNPYGIYDLDTGLLNDLGVNVERVVL